MSKIPQQPHVPERRVAYRAEPAQKNGLAVALIHDGRTIRVNLVDLTFAGAGLVTPDTLELRVGSPITLQFNAKEMALPAAVRAAVRSRTPYGNNLRYGVEFYSPSSLQNKLPPRLLGAFNRRRAFRVAPDSHKPIDANVVRQTGNITILLPMISISATGCALLARSADKQLLMAGDLIQLSFQIPDVSGVLVLHAHVRYGQKQRGGIRYGIEFDADESPMFQRQQKVIQTYVMEQQRKMLSTD